MRPTRLKAIWIAALVAVVCLLGYTLRSSSDTAPPMTEELLAEVIQDWHNSYPSTQRFERLADFNYDAVLDMTTGLVWEKSPQPATVTYNEARQFLVSRVVGEQKGWRLPSPIELRSLVGPIRGLSRPHLPPNHPFLNVQATSYWAMVSETDHGPYGKYIDAFLGNILSFFTVKMFSFPVWCVRGPLMAEAN
jgi:hypothetical protein